jgi:16S rRNA (cytosine967-C5)-methyltransferase
VRWKKTPDSLDALMPSQRRLLGKAAELLAPGGRLLYATCTTRSRENSGNIEWLLREHCQLQSLALSREAGGYWQTFPRPRQSEGFFAAALEKK